MKDQTTTIFPPVVAVLGHVDHGKTTLLDAIRKSSIAARETGGITQKIGASSIIVKHEGADRRITLIDTPGHEAFANMRSQGVSAADIILLIVASDDGVKPQTRESIEKIKESKLPFIVVLTKSDLETAQVEKVKNELLKEEILLEGMGGDVPCIEVSAKTGKNVDALLGLILLSYDLSGVKKSDEGGFLGVVIDAKIDKRRGIVGSVVVKTGKLAIGQKVFVPGQEAGKIRAFIDPEGNQVKTVSPGDAVEILGLTKVLPAGSVLQNTAQEILPVQVAEALVPVKQDLAFFFSDENKDTLPLILKTETSAEIEAIKEYLPEKAKVVYEGQGDIAVSDILLAKDFKAIVVGFNVGVAKDAQRLAQADHVYFKTYKIIYELLDELQEAIDALMAGPVEKYLGKAQILARFEGTEGVIIGVKVLEGRLSVKDRVILMRGDKELGASNISSIKHGKEDIKDAGKNTECGIMVSPELDFTVGDMILSRSIKR